MKFGYDDTKHYLAGFALCFLVTTGTYNAIVINSESSISGANMRFTKRLDEVYRTTESNRGAASIQWQKIAVKQSALEQIETSPSQVPSGDASASSVATNVAAVKEELSLNLTAVANPRKWQQGLTNTQFSGNLSTNDGVIENLTVSLPNGEGVSISFSEMSGNVFEYDFQGELYSGMMYQEGQRSYVVSLTNGPLEGTRLTFTGEPSMDEQLQLDESQRILAETDEAGAGMNTPEPVQETTQVAEIEPQQIEQVQNLETQEAYNPELGQTDQQLQEQARVDQAQSQNFNFEQTGSHSTPNQAAM